MTEPWSIEIQLYGEKKIIRKSEVNYKRVYLILFQGLQDVVFDNQTSLSLVSNGVEVIMIHKKFFTDQLNVSQFVRLREKVCVYYKYTLIIMSASPFSQTIPFYT